MSMISYLRQITPAELDRYVNGSADLKEWRHEPGTIGIVAWNDLLKLITGSSDRNDTPLYKAMIRGGKCLNESRYNTDPETHLGYAYYLTPQEVSLLAPEVLKTPLNELVDKLEAELEAITLDEYGYEVVAEDAIVEYPEDVEDILSDFKRLRDFYESASQKGNAVLLSIV